MVEVYSLTGQRVYQSSLNSGNNSIQLDKGIYLVRIRTDKQQATRKVYIAGH
ncbi:MAG: T9SS type A sorting domain-containing protein [Flavobacteriales bacterium]|nr:T9SS type A sorting domain-containing protein [Flavobacteriales bacterium]